MRKKQEDYNYTDDSLKYRTRYGNTSLPLNHDYEKTPFVLGKDFSSSNIVWTPITKNLEINISIPEGYQITPGKQMYVKTSLDQHSIAFVVLKEEVITDLNFADETNQIINMDTCVDIFKIKLVGNLFYNSVVGNLEPIGSRFTRNETLINSYGGIVFNDTLAYVDDIDQVPHDIKDSITYNIIVNSVKMNSSDSNLMTQDLNNTGSIVTVSMTMVVTSNQGPIS